jgi:dynein intermediate chain 1, axonemal
LAGLLEPLTTRNYNFSSISSDGRVMNWNLMKNKLEPEELINLKLTARNNEDA